MTRSDALMESSRGLLPKSNVLKPASALLSASTLLYAFRALPAAPPSAQTRLRKQIAQVVKDFLPCDVIDVCIYGQEADPSLPAELAEKLRKGDPVRNAQGWVALPIREFKRIAGFIAAHLPNHKELDLDDYEQILSAVVSIATAALENARELERTRLDNELLRKDAAVSPAIIGRSAPIRELHDLIGRVAGTDSTVLILGESGTGKELVARALHDQSDRNKAPFVAINSAAIADSLLESELFGYERGAFTGAVGLKRGKLEVAQGGTVFLDEIGDLQAALQAKLLRVLEQREFERVGGTKAIPLDIRFVAATHHDLANAVAAGKFRQDLYHRLNVVPIHTPPLRERPDDILPLARHFLEMTATANKRRAPAISRDAQKVLLAYGWPGNVRELRNAMERAVVLGRSELVELADLPPALSQAPAHAKAKVTYQDVLGDAKKDSILQAYRQAAGSYKGAAELLKLHPNYLLRLVRNLGLADDVKKIQGRSATT